MEISVTQLNWAAGELSPKMSSRDDLPSYKTGSERIVNFISENSGPVRYRSGFQYVQNTRRHAVAWLIPFQFNDSDAYELEFTAGFIRFHRNNGIVVLAAKTITGASVAAGIITIASVAHGYSNGDEVIISGVTGMTQLNNRSFVIANKSDDAYDLHDSFDVAVDGTTFSAYVSGGISEKIYEITNPYAIADIPAIKYAQNADTMYLVHRGYAPQKLVRTSNTSWAIGTFSRTADPFSSGNYPGAVAFYQGRLYYAGTLLYPESIWGSLALDADGNPQYDNFTLGTNAADAFKFTLAPISGKVDVIQSLVPGLNFLAICTFEGISKANGGTDGSTISPSTIDITPVVTAGVLQQISPHLLGISMIYIHRSGLILFSLEFDIFYNAYNALDKTLTNDQWTESGITQMAYSVNRPTGFWFARNDGILIWVSYMVKENINASNRMIIGGVSPKVLSIGSMPRANQYDQLWIVSERVIGGKTNRFVEYMTDPSIIPERDDYRSGDDNEVADDLRWRNAMFEKQKEYVCMDAALTYDGSDYGAAANATLTPGALTGNSITFIASNPVFDATMVGRQLWKQAQDGVGTGRAEIISFVSTTEVVCNIISAFDTVVAMPANKWYLTTDSLSGAWHLEGETCKILADGGEHPEQVVTNGIVTLEYQASVVHLGLGYVGFIKSMHLNSGSPQVPSEAREMNVNRCGVKFRNTLGARYGTDLYKMKDFQFSQLSDLMGRPSPLFSEHLNVPVEDDSSLKKHFYIQQVRPLPCNIDDITLFVEFGEQ